MPPTLGGPDDDLSDLAAPAPAKAFTPGGPDDDLSDLTAPAPQDPKLGTKDDDLSDLAIPYHTLSPVDRRALFDAQAPADRSLLEKAGSDLADLGAGAWKGVKGLAALPGEALAEAKTDIERRNAAAEAENKQFRINPIDQLYRVEQLAGTGVSTALEGAVKGVKNLTVPFAKAGANALGGIVNPTSSYNPLTYAREGIDRANGMSAEQADAAARDRAFADWDAHQQELSRAASGQPATGLIDQAANAVSLKPYLPQDVAPLDKASEIVGLYSGVPGAKSPLGKAIGNKLSKLPGVAGTAERLAAVKAGAKARLLAGVEKTGQGLQAAAELPAKAVHAVVEKLTGNPELAKKASEFLSVGTGAAWIPGAGEHGLGVAGRVISGTQAAGTALEKGAQAARVVSGALGKTTSQPVFDAISKNTANPLWLRTAAAKIAASPLADNALAASLRVGGAAVHGAAFNAALGAAGGQDAGEVGEGAAVGAAFGGLHGGLHEAGKVVTGNPEGRAADVMAGRLKLIADGTDPSVAAGLDDATAHQIAQWQQITGGKLKIQVVDAAKFGELTGDKGQAGVFFDDGSNRLIVRQDSVRGIGTVLRHEAGHFLDQYIAPAHLDAALESAIGGDGLAKLKDEYATQMVKSRKAVDLLPGEVAPEVTPEELAAQKQALDDNDPRWLQKELLAEVTKDALFGQDLRQNVLRRGSVPGDDSAATKLYALGRKLQRALGGGQDLAATPETTRPIFSTDLRDPKFNPVRKLVHDAIRKANTEVEGVSKPVKKETTDTGIEVTPAMAGKHEGVPLRYNAKTKRFEGEFHVAKDVELAPGTPKPKEGDPLPASAKGKVVLKPKASVAKTERSRQEEVRQNVTQEQVQPAEGGKPELAPRVQGDGTTKPTGTKLGDWFFQSKTFGPTAKETGKAMEASIESGQPLEVWYQAVASGSNSESGMSWSKDLKKTKGNVAVTNRTVLPYGFEVSSKGNVLVKLLDLTRAAEKAKRWQAEGKLSHWNGDTGAFYADLKAVLANHAAGRPGETGLDGPSEAKKDAINAFLVGDVKSAREANPLREGLEKTDRAGVLRSFRIDRVSSSKPTGEDFGKFDYNKAKKNFSPESDQTETPEFKKWFGTSKVVDPQGKPLVVYHGTDAEFNTFDRNKSEKGPSKFGFWFTDQKDFAEFFGGTQKAVYVNIKNPLIIPPQKWDRMREAHGGDPVFFSKQRADAEAKGYDGVIVPGKKEKVGRFDIQNPSVYAAFRPEQIKSASENNGNFDPTNPDIRFSPDARRDDKFRGAIRGLAEQSGFSDVAISDIAKSTGVSPQEAVDWVRAQSRAGNVVPSRGDWSLASPEMRKAHLEIFGEPYLRVRLTGANNPVEPTEAPAPEPAPAAAAAPAPTAKPVSDATIHQAYRKLVDESGYSDVAISDIAKATGMSNAQAGAWALAQSRAGRLVPSRGDWSLAAPAVRAGAVEIGGEPYLRVRLLPKGSFSPDGKLGDPSEEKPLTGGVDYENPRAERPTPQQPAEDARRVIGGAAGTSPSVAASVARGAAPTDFGSRASHPSVQRAATEQSRALANQARKDGRLFRPAQIKALGKRAAQGQEHEVYATPDGQHVVKITRPDRGGYGLTPSVAGGELLLRPGTPAEYLDRLRLSNETFADDVRYEGMVVQPSGRFGIVTSQPTVHEVTGKPTPSPQETERFFVNLGFQPVAGTEGHTYYRAADNVAVFDAHAGNLVRTEKGLLPIDLVVVHPDDRLLQYLEEGLQGEP